MLALAAVPVGLYLGQHHALGLFCAAISRSAGIPVAITGGIWGTARPSVVIAGLRIGGETSVLTVDRLELDLELSLSQRPTVKRVRLLRPALKLARLDFSQWSRSAPASGSAAFPAERGTLPSTVAVQIEDGSVDADLLVSGREIHLRARGISLRPGQPHARLVLGPAALSTNGEDVLQLASAAADLDLRDGLRPIRIAVLGGKLRPPGPSSTGGLNLHSATLRWARGRRFLRLRASPEGPNTGLILVRGELGPGFLPGSPGGLRVELQGVDLRRLGSPLEDLGLHLSGSRLSGILSIGRSGEKLSGTLTLRLEELRVQHGLLARQLVGPLTADLSGGLELDPVRGELSVNGLKLATGSIALHISGGVTLHQGRGAVLALRFQLPETPCQKVLSSLPQGLAPRLRGLALEGNLGVEARLRLDTRDLDATDVDFGFSPLGCRVTADPPMADVRTLHQPLAIEVSGPRGTGMRWELGPKNPYFARLWEISKHARTAFLVAEDAHFFDHQGFDREQLRRAFIADLKEGRPVRGASTISQQLVKNVFLGHERTLSRKLQEAVLTWRLEQVIPKDRILELYLNLVEMGPGIYGIAQASRVYFHRGASDLTALQAAKLAALTPSPRQLAEGLAAGRPAGVLLDRVQLLLRLMRRGHGRSNNARSPAPPLAVR